MMTRLTLIACLVCISSVGAAQPREIERPARVEGIVFSADGSRVMAGFFVPAMNEPGTDWDAWVTQWDLNEGTRKTIRNACWPVSFGDGEIVSMGFFERKQHEMRPAPREAKWKFGEEKPTEIHEEIPFKQQAKNDGFILAADRMHSAQLKNGKLEVDDRTTNKHRQFLAASGATAWRPDSKAIAIADATGVIRIWDVERGNLLGTLRSHGDDANTVRVAAMQFRSEFLNPGKNRRELIENVRAAAMWGAQIVVLPEAAIPGYMSDDIKQTWQAHGEKVSDGLQGVDVKPIAETVPGESTRAFAKVAEELGIYVTVPLIEVDPKTQKFYNTVVVLDPDGQIAIHYRKKNPWPWAERGWASDGNLANPVIDTPWGRLGTLVCFDIHNEARGMRDLKVDILLYSIAWVDEGNRDWFAKKLPAIAKENKFAIIGANWTVPFNAKPKWSGFGHSEVIDANGNVLAKAQHDVGEELVFADIPVGAAP